mmetsp:Transcript_17445/g.15330  ORF Transcript_17445/g.15330 Transcript_17445/m.15330 type:complete len:88 (-) Transcript_17445:569-832(-)
MRFYENVINEVFNVNVFDYIDSTPGLPSLNYCTPKMGKGKEKSIFGRKDAPPKDSHLTYRTTISQKLEAGKTIQESVPKKKVKLPQN